MTAWYRTGTLSVTNGSTAVTGTTTGWTDSTVRAGDALFVPASSNYPGEISTVNSTTNITLAANWHGTTQTGVTYFIFRGMEWGDVTRLAVEISALIADQVDILSGNGVPSDSLGSNGSVYFRQDVAEYYAKVAGTWGSAISLTGPTGATGATGATGSTGPANSLSIGTVTTGAAGSSASVTVTGTAPNQVVNFTIPRGATGVTGATGATGSTGVTGAAGPSYYATSVTSNLIETGTKIFETQAGLAYAVGASRVRWSDSSGANFVEGLVTAYSSTTMTVAVDLTDGSGTITSWFASIAGQRGAAGAGSVSSVNSISPVSENVTLTASDIDAAYSPAGYTAGSANINAHLTGIDAAIADKQPLDATLTTLSALSLVSGDILYATAADTLARLAKGSNGQFLSLVSGIPSWASSVSSVALKIPATGTYTPTTGLLFALAIVTGGGGGGGGVSTTTIATAAAGGGGGAAGSTAISLLTAASIGASKAVTIGVGGTAGATTPGAGGAGGTSSIGTLVVAPGGAGGASATRSTVGFTGGAGGVGVDATTGTLKIPGASGAAASGASGLAIGGSGGASFWGGGGPGAASNNSVSGVTGSTAGAYGAGGGGGARSGQIGVGGAGGAGKEGIVFILEFIA